MTRQEAFARYTREADRLDRLAQQPGIQEYNRAELIRQRDLYYSLAGDNASLD